MGQQTTDEGRGALSSLYPDLSAEQLAEAEARLDEYLEVVLRVAERIDSDPELQRQFDALTQQRQAFTMSGEPRRSS